MSLREDISTQINASLKSGDKPRLSTLRLLLSAVKYKEIEVKKELTDSEVQQIATTLSKQRRESIELFRKGDRVDLAEKEEAELEILLEFIPPQLSEEELSIIVKETAAETGASTIKEMGKLMGAVMGKVKGKADGNLVQKLVKGVLGG